MEVGAVLILLILLAYVIIVYNRLVWLRLRCRQADADVLVQYAQRHDLIPNLVETVKAYSTYERETLEAVITARRAAMGAPTAADRAVLEAELTGAVNRVVGLAEAYPELRAGKNFLRLQSELADLENKIGSARRFYNNSVTEYEGACRQFPAIIFARSLGFAPSEFFKLDQAELGAIKRPPTVRF